MRRLNALAAAILGGALIGFLVGTGPMPRPPPPTPAPVRLASGGARAGVTYASLRQRRAGPQAAVTSDLTRLRAFPAVDEPVERSEAMLQDTRRRRAEGRAYDGAPPGVPHDLDEQSSGACLACHAEGLLLEDRLAPRIPHEAVRSCTQCHLPAGERPGTPALLVSNTFLGARSQGGGGRAWPGAPPTVPHGTALRDDCASCHGVTGWPGLRSTHPERFQCTQCHVQAGGAEPWAAAP